MGDLLLLTLLLPLAFMVMHAGWRGEHSKLAIGLQCFYGAFLIVLSSYALFGGLAAEWIGPRFSLAMTGIRMAPSFYLDARNAPLVLLLGIALPLVFIWLRDREGRHKASYYISANLMAMSLCGVFISESLLLFYLFWEFSLVGAYFWIGMHGRAGWHTPSVYSALIRFVLFTLLGSLPMLVSIIALLAFRGEDPGIFGISAILPDYSPLFQNLIFWGFFAAFAVKMPLFGLHGWLRNTYAVAPVACRALLSGVMSKMGAYGFLIILVQGFPQQLVEAAPYLRVIAVAGALYGGLVCLSRTRLIDIIIYSSLAHLSLIALGLFSGVTSEGFDNAGLAGALFQMLNHGLIMVALFAFDARIAASGESPEVHAAGGLRPAQLRLSALLLLSVFASASLPGLSNFAGEILIYYSAFSVSPWLTFWAAVGALITAAALVRAYHRIYLGPVQGNLKPAPDFGILDTGLGVLLGGFWVLLGLYPMLFLGPVERVLGLAGMAAGGFAP